MAYLRFWVVKVLIRSNPLAAFVGSPIYVLYLRALGARIGRDVTILFIFPLYVEAVRFGRSFRVPEKAVHAYLRDALALALPTQIVCREDCLGLCPVCGENLNEAGPDHAHEREPDPRWAALRELKLD